MTRYPFAFWPPSIDYRDVRITRGDALKLQRKFMMFANPRLLTSAQRNGRPGAPRHKREAVKAVLRQLYPDGVPHDMKNAAVAAAVQEVLMAKGNVAVSPRTIDKAREEFAQE